LNFETLICDLPDEQSNEKQFNEGSHIKAMLKRLITTLPRYMRPENESRFAFVVKHKPGYEGLSAIDCPLE
jgi:hypothetical protein